MFFPPNTINTMKCSEILTATVFTQRHVPLRFRPTTFRNCGRTTTAKVTFLSKSAPAQCKRNLVLLFFCAVFRPIWSCVNVVLKLHQYVEILQHVLCLMQGWLRNSVQMKVIKLLNIFRRSGRNLYLVYYLEIIYI